MVESFGMQQVLQLSSVVERAQTAQLHQADEVARGFDKELEKVSEREKDKTHATKETEESRAINDSDPRKPKHYARRLPKPPGEKEEEKKEEQAPVEQAGGEGRLVDVIA